MKILKTILILSLLVNIVGGWILYLYTTRTIAIESIGNSSVYQAESFVSASGTLSPQNYENSSFYVVDISCNLLNRLCTFASVSGGESGHFFISQDFYEITSADNTKVIIENGAPNCRREIWKIDLISKAIYLESHPKDLKDQIGDCSFMERKVLNSKFVSFFDRRKELGK